MKHGFYASEEEINAELTSSCRTNAKIILAQLNKNLVYNSLPWSVSSSLNASNEDHGEEIAGIHSEVVCLCAACGRCSR